MSPKLVRTNPPKVENRGIRHHYFSDWYHEKVLSNQLKSLSNLTFLQMFWLFGLFLFTDFTRKEVNILVLTMAKI